MFLSGIVIYAQQPTDCIESVTVCGNSNVNLDVNGIGTQELSGSNTCSSQENNSVWLKMTLVTSGTLGFTLTPNSSAITEDYDFFVFGPNVPCNNIGQAIRCSTTNPQAAGQGNNLTGMNASSSDTSEGPGPDGDSFVRWLDVQAGETYYIVIDRPIGNSPFTLDWTGTSEFSTPPIDESSVSPEPINLESCDVFAPFDNGFTEFDLNQNTNPIIGSQTDVVVTYHATESDANIGINPLSSPYLNKENPQIIYTRITNSITGCFELTNFELSVNIGPEIKTPQPYSICDNADDGDRNNGRVTFDLTTRQIEILNGLDAADYNFSYYTLLADAEIKNAPLPNPYYNNIPFLEQIFVRVEDVLNPDCNTITTLDLVVNINPEAFDANLVQCDEDGVIDGITIFNLNEADEILTGGIPNRYTRFYSDSAKTNEIDGSSYVNKSAFQIIYVDVVNEDTGCSTSSELRLEVSLTDSVDAQLTECDDDGIEDGFYKFDLTNAESFIIEGLPSGLNVSYFESYEEALLEVNNLSRLFTNTKPYLQTIFARVENVNDCYGISELDLVVNELPNILVEEISYYCLNTFPEPITLDAALIDEDQSNYQYNWSNGSTTYDIQINTAGTYSVVVTNGNNCSKERIIVVEDSNIATFENIDIIDAAENNTITVFVSGEGIYEYRLLDENNVVSEPYQSDNVFENVIPGIYTVSVRDIKNNCGTVNKALSVIGFPKYFTPNNDGINDTWQVYGISSMFQPNSKILIFNRFGKLLKEINPTGEGWNGMINNKVLPSDDYWFSIVLQDGRIFKGHFTLKV